MRSKGPFCRAKVAMTAWHGMKLVLESGREVSPAFVEVFIGHGHLMKRQRIHEVRLLELHALQSISELLHGLILQAADGQL